MSEFSECVFCGAIPQYRQQTVAGIKMPVCEVCASLGAAMLEEGGGACLCCLHLTAMELEVAADGFKQGRRFRKVLTGIRARFDRSAFRAVCPCATCKEVREGVGGDLLHLEFDDGTVVFTDLDLPLGRIRQLPPGSMVSAPSGEVVPVEVANGLWVSENRRLTADPGLTPDGLRQAAAAHVSGSDGWIGFGSVAAAVAGKQAARDAASLQHWNMVRKYGRGLRDGDFWLTRDGCVIPLEDADRVLPMTAADRRALAADHLRAARWRSGQ